MKKLMLLAILTLTMLSNTHAQTIFVDAVKGTNKGSGTITDPTSNLENAVTIASRYAGNEPITIKVAPGLYIIHHLMIIKSASSNDTLKFTIEASIMPDDTAWTPYKMPVIESVSDDNLTTYFPHTGGFLVAKNNVSIKGLKFVGNPNPSIKYYYPITREKEMSSGLEISQCYFVGERNSLPIQGAVYTNGGGIHVHHCIFYECKNALLLFQGIKDFSVTNSIIYGSYESAVWFGPFNSDFVFKDNIVSHCNFFWVRPDSTQPAYHFDNSLITDNTHFMGYYSRNGLVDANINAHVETNIQKTGKVLLREVETEGIPGDYLNLTPESDGRDLHAGIFTKPNKAQTSKNN